jgi:hypothetical protein
LASPKKGVPRKAPRTGRSSRARGGRTGVGADAPERPLTAGERLKAWTERAFPVVLLVAVAGVLGAGGAVWQAGKATVAWTQETFFWRQAAFHRLAQLRVGLTLQRATELLGDPAFIRPDDSGGLREFAFKGRDHWVQLVVTPGGSVASFVVSSCAEDFRPEFISTTAYQGEQVGDESISYPMGRVTLNETPISEVARDTAAPFGVEYRPYADRSGVYAEWLRSNNATSGVSYAWGVAAICPAYTTDDQMHSLTSGYRWPAVDQTPPWENEDIASWRKVMKANSWGACDESCDPAVGPLQSFEFGVDPERARAASD